MSDTDNYLHIIRIHIRIKEITSLFNFIPNTYILRGIPIYKLGV